MCAYAVGEAAQSRCRPLCVKKETRAPARMTVKEEKTRNRRNENVSAKGMRARCRKSRGGVCKESPARGLALFQ